MRHEEDSLQLELLLWLQAEHRDLFLHTIHVPMGGWRNKREAARLKVLGAKPGVPDLLCFLPRGGYLGAGLELKTGKNKPTKDQIRWLKRLAKCGWCTAWVNSPEQAKAFFIVYAELETQK